MKGKGGGKNVSLFKFASRGGKGAMLQRKKEEDTVRAMKKAAALRKYAKLCKREGIVSDRVNLDGARAAIKEDHVELQEFKQKHKTSQQQQHKHNPFAGAEREAQKARDDKEEAERARECVQGEIKKAELSREAKRREHMKRNKKGQPLLNSTAKSLLAKIQAKTG